MIKKSSIREVLFVALFASLTVIGTMIRIPLPTGAFVHLGNAVLLLAVLLLGYTKGALAGGLGFMIFDILNGYAIEAPYFLFESFVVGAFASIAFLLYKKKPTHVWQLIVIGSVAGVGKLLMTQIKNTVLLLFLGNDFRLAFMTAIVKLPASIINVLMTIVIVSLLYFPLKRLLERNLT